MTPSSDPGTAPDTSLSDWDDNVWASSSSSDLRRTFAPSLTNTPPGTIRSSHTLHRRRTSENASTTGRKKMPWTFQYSHSETSDSVRVHPLWRDSGGLPSSPSNDPTVTRPILNLRLSPGTVIDADEDPAEVEHEGRADSCEKEELVLVHEVSSISSGIRRSASASSYSQDRHSR